MNNFSPSTDTSVGTKRFTAQEVQLAYTLMAVEYMKTIKGLNPNHQLVDKAVKLQALGFTNSKEVGDTITSEEDFINLNVNYSGNGSPLRYVTGMPIDSMSYPVGRYFIRQEPSHIGLMYLSRNKARMKLRFNTQRGVLSVEDLWDLPLIQLDNIAKHIIDVKLQEQEDRLLESEKKAKRQKILDLMAKKQDAELEGKSLEELTKELEALN